MYKNYIKLGHIGLSRNGRQNKKIQLALWCYNARSVTNLYIYIYIFCHSAVQHVPLCLCSFLAATSQFSVFIGQKMQLTGWENTNNMRNAKCADTQTSMEWPYCSFLYWAWHTYYTTTQAGVNMGKHEKQLLYLYYFWNIYCNMANHKIIYLLWNIKVITMWKIKVKVRKWESYNWNQEWIFWGMQSVQGAAHPTKVLLHPKEMFVTPPPKFASLAKVQVISIARTLTKIGIECISNG